MNSEWPRGSGLSYPQGSHRGCTRFLEACRSTDRQAIQELPIVDNFVDNAWTPGERAVDKRGELGAAERGPQRRQTAHI